MVSINARGKNHVFFKCHPNGIDIAVFHGGNHLIDPVKELRGRGRLDISFQCAACAQALIDAPASLLLTFEKRLRENPILNCRVLT